MKITVLDSNTKVTETMLQAIGICRGKECTLTTLENALEAKPVPHMSVLEFGWICLMVEGVSVKTRIQLERHRLYSSIERSTRSLDMSHEEIVIPKTVKNRDLFFWSLKRSIAGYMDALERGESLEDASYLLPLGITTKFLLSGNLRTWFEYFGKRLCRKHVQDEHYRMALNMWHEITELFPIMRKAHPCKECGDCAVSREF